MSNPEVSIVVLSYNRQAEIEKNLPYLAAWTEKTQNELILVENKSTDDSLAIARKIAEQYPHIQIVANEENLGVGLGRNKGFRLAKGDIILNLDDDSRPDENFLDDLTALFRAYPDVGILSPLIVHPTLGMRQNGDSDDPHYVANFHGSCHAISKVVFEKIGYLDPDCRFGGEEIDFSIRAHKVGIKTLYHPDYKCYHNNFVRDNKQEDHFRVSQWHYNYCRVLGKSFPAPVARKFARAYRNHQFAKLLFSKKKMVGLGLFMEMCKKGLADGMKQNEPCPQETLDFYMNPHMIPEYGNVTLTQKIIWKLMKKKIADPPRAERKDLSAYRETSAATKSS